MEQEKMGDNEFDVKVQNYQQVLRELRASFISNGKINIKLVAGAALARTNILESIMMDYEDELTASEMNLMYGWATTACRMVFELILNGSNTEPFDEFLRCIMEIDSIVPHYEQNQFGELLKETRV